jgi:anti-anti-sigma regulatory factor
MTALVPQFDNAAAVQFFDSVRETPFSEDMKLDASNVQHITTLAVQVLLALDNTLKQQGHKLFVENPSADFTETLTDMGLSDVIKRWSNA